MHEGTLAYLCPAYLRTKRYTPASDVYSYGIVLLQVGMRGAGRHIGTGASLGLR